MQYSRIFARTSCKTPLAQTALAQTALALAMMSGAYAPAQAQQASQPNASTSPTGAAGDIVVTARRRNERLQDVPISVTAFNQASLDKRAIRTMDDLSRIAPGITFTRNGSGASANYNDENSDVAIRGIDSTAGSSTTGVYVNDTPIQGRHMAYGTVNAFPALFDVASVEVLRGPQGTLFGSGSEGGTVRFVSPEPNLSGWSAYARAEVNAVGGGGAGYTLGAAVGGPLVEDKLGFRLSLSDNRDAGWVNRVDPNSGAVTAKNANWQNTVTARLALKYAASDSLTISPSAYLQTLHINDTGAYWASLSNPANGTYNNANALRDTSTDPFYILALKVDWKPALVDVTWVSSYFHRNQHAQSDYTQYDRTLFSGTTPTIAPGDAAPAYFQDKQRNWVEEIKLGSKDGPSRLKWTAGLFWSHTNENTPETAYDPTLAAEFPGALSPLPGANGQTYSQPVFQVKDTQIAGFGEFNYKIVPQLTATAGLRFTSIHSTGAFGAGGTIVFADYSQSSGTLNETALTPRFILNYQPTRDNTLYVSASKGFRPGGLNLVQANACSATNPSYASDSLWSYEAGSKNVFSRIGLTLNASAFYINWKNIQQNEYFAACDFQQTVNLGGLHSRGFELEAQWKVSPALSLGATVNYIDAVYTDTIGVPQLVAAGDHVPGSPLNVTLNLDYTAPETHGLRPYAHADFAYAARQAGLTPLSNPNDFLADATNPQAPTYSTTGIRLGARAGNLDWAFFITNLFDTHPVLFQSRDLPGTPDSLYFARSLRPRSFGLSLTYRN